LKSPLLPFILLLLIPIALASDLSIHFIDVGEGDATLILNENWTVLIDSGGSDPAQGEKLREYLAVLNVARVNLAIATSSDLNHIGQFGSLAESLAIDEFWINGLRGDSDEGESLIQTLQDKGVPTRVVARSDYGRVGDMLFIVLNPLILLGDRGADSMVVKLSYLNVSLLFTGDTDSRAEEDMIASCAPCLGVDILKLGDHGSRSSSTPAFLDTIWPYVAVASAGWGNEDGHPHNETLGRLAQRGIFLFRTDTHEGLVDDVVATTDGYSWTIRQASTGRTWEMPEGALLLTGMMMIQASAAVHLTRRRLVG
jgi:beta-lactamase superfamily II metal-dependent hydrolase